MADISLEDIIKEAKKRKIELGENPEKTIKLSAKLGLIPKPRRKRSTHGGKSKTTLLFPENTMNPEEGELRPQLLDRFGLAVDVQAEGDIEARAEVVRRRIAFDHDPEGFCTRWAAAEEAEQARLLAARQVLPTVHLDDALLRLITGICTDFGVDGLRADIVMYRAEVFLAAYESRTAVSYDDIHRALSDDVKPLFAEEAA